MESEDDVADFLESPDSSSKKHPKETSNNVIEVYSPSFTYFRSFLTSFSLFFRLTTTLPILPLPLWISVSGLFVLRIFLIDLWCISSDTPAIVEERPPGKTVRIPYALVPGMNIYSNLFLKALSTLAKQVSPAALQPSASISDKKKPLEVLCDLGPGMSLRFAYKSAL